jgi:signal recognition particle subunit SRP19
MRKQQKMVLWPSYIDSSKTRREGRRVAKGAAVSNPALSELLSAAAKLKMKPEAETGAAHPACSWKKTGRIVLQKRGTKAQTVAMIAKEITVMRQQAKK